MIRILTFLGSKDVGGPRKEMCSMKIFLRVFALAAFAWTSVSKAELQSDT